MDLHEDHLNRAQVGYDLVSELHQLAKDPKNGLILFEYDYLKTMVYPIVNEEPTSKYRATHKSLIIFGVHCEHQ